MDRAKFIPNSLSTRLFLLMTLALFPLGLIAVWQTREVIAEAEEISRAALLAETIAHASEERNLIQQALGAADGLAQIAPTLENDACSDLMRTFVAKRDVYVFAGFVPLDGVMTCSTSDKPVDFSSAPTFDEYILRETPFVEMNRNGTVSGQSVLIVSQPTRNIEGTLLGRTALSIPHTIANQLLDPEDNPDGLKLASINSQGEIVSAFGSLDRAPNYLPGELDLQDLPALSGRTFRATSGDGRDRLFAVAPLVEDTLYLIGSWPTDIVAKEAALARGRLAILFPILMWATGVGVAVFGMQRLVLRHISALRSAMRQFALGERSSKGLVLDDPPLELAEAQRAFNRMALIVTEAEARQEEDLRDKEVLLREVHHRVKNNLQLIASIMNMQMRRASSKEAKRMLAGLQQRVRGLAMLHRTLYTTPDMTTIESDELIKTVINDASNLITDQRQKLTSELERFPLYPDQAVPLSMLTAEALTNAFKYADASQDIPIRVTLEKHTEQITRLSVSNPVLKQSPQKEVEPSGDGLGSQLLKAFVRQLDGALDTRIVDGIYHLEVTFERRDFDHMDDAKAGAHDGAL